MQPQRRSDAILFLRSLSNVVKTQGTWIECGKIGRPWGIKGQIVVFWMSGACPVEVGRGVVYTRGTDGDYVPHLVLASRENQNRSIVTLEGLKNPNDASALTHELLYIPEGELQSLSKGEFYCYQILGLKVETDGGKHLGEIVNIIPTGSNDVYEVKPLKGPTILIPAIKSVIVKVDIENKKMIVRPMEGMLD